MENLTLQDLMDRYLQFGKVIRNYASATIMSYKGTFKLFLQETKIEDPKELSKKVIEEWFYNGRLNRNWSSGTFRDHLKHLNPLFKWLVKEGHIPENYANELEKPRLEHKLPKTLSKVEAQLILETSFNLPYTYRFEKYRNFAIVAIMLLAGLRRNEVMKLKYGEVSLDNKSIFINQGKWGKDRIIPMNNRLQTVLLEYIQRRKKMKKESIYFFTGVQRDLPIGVKLITRLMARLRIATGIQFSAHTLRHGFARLMLEGGCDIYTLSKLMGHSKITTTTIYLSCSNQQMSKGVEMHVLN
ncbi:tyrosine-type recombinase/integrase [Patescibacteria group bacterium]